MAEGFDFACDHCGRTIEAWSDGNPYYIDEDGEKQYAYHPDHENLARCVGNDEPHLCGGCGAELLVDSQDPINLCPECGSQELIDVSRLEGKACPSCREGVFRLDTSSMRIS